MPRYKRTFEEAELDISLDDEVPPEQAATLAKLRNMWEFASLMQYIFLFGHVVKIDDDFDIEVRTLPARRTRIDVGSRSCVEMDTDGNVMIGPRSGVLEASTCGETGADWSRPPQICFFPPWSDVCTA